MSNVHVARTRKLVGFLLAWCVAVFVTGVIAIACGPGVGPAQFVQYLGASRDAGAE